jgi:peptidoglycan/LPS O-acetylase OafA/YrhL
VVATRTASASGRPIKSVPLATVFRGRSNSVGFLRWALAVLVVVDHSFPIGGFAGGVDSTWAFSRGQDSLGGIAVAGFFVLSGFLVTRSWFSSGSVYRFIWRRFLRIFPGFWVCLIVTAVVFAPIAWWHEHRTLAGLFSLDTDSPWHYVTANFWLHIDQWNIDHLFASSPLVASGFAAGLNGSLWTLLYEL